LGEGAGIGSSFNSGKPMTNFMRSDNEWGHQVIVYADLGVSQKSTLPLEHLPA